METVTINEILELRDRVQAHIDSPSSLVLGEPPLFCVDSEALLEIIDLALTTEHKRDSAGQ